MLSVFIWGLSNLQNSVFKHGKCCQKLAWQVHENRESKTCWLSSFLTSQPLCTVSKKNFIALHRILFPHIITNPNPVAPCSHTPILPAHPILGPGPGSRCTGRHFDAIHGGSFSALQSWNSLVLSLSCNGNGNPPAPENVSLIHHRSQSREILPLHVPCRCCAKLEGDTAPRVKPDPLQACLLLLSRFNSLPIQDWKSNEFIPLRRTMLYLAMEAFSELDVQL